jgi:hypothetical protein
VAAAEHCRPNGHEVCHGVVSIADELEMVSLLLAALGAGLRRLLGDCLRSKPT